MFLQGREGLLYKGFQLAVLSRLRCRLEETNVFLMIHHGMMYGCFVKLGAFEFRQLGKHFLVLLVRLTWRGHPLAGGQSDQLLIGFRVILNDALPKITKRRALRAFHDELPHADFSHASLHRCARELRIPFSQLTGSFARFCDASDAHRRAFARAGCTHTGFVMARAANKQRG